MGCEGRISQVKDLPDAVSMTSVTTLHDHLRIVNLEFNTALFTVGLLVGLDCFQGIVILKADVMGSFIINECAIDSIDLFVVQSSIIRI
jgi:hypothetical protein